MTEPYFSTGPRLVLDKGGVFASANLRGGGEFGETWHNGHHAFPTSARHGLRPWQLDPSATLITLLEKVGLAWDVVRISPRRIAEKTRSDALAPATV